VLLDHGLYRRLNNEFRIEYSKLWKALILGDIQGITESATNMNAADSVPLFAGMLTQRQWKDVTKWEKGTKRLGHQRTQQEKEEIQEFVGQHAQEIGSLLGKLPRELLLLLKTNDCLRSVDKELGAGYNSFMVTARECVRALNADRQAKQPGVRSRVRSIIERTKLEGRLQAMQMYSFLSAY
jgi:aarF domain-containing kinase